MATSKKHISASTPSFQILPNELIDAVCHLLPNRDVKSLRLTCRHLRDTALLRLDRVFISANPLNIQVLLAIANHNIFRHRVKEIIWDDATLTSIQNDEGYQEFGYSSDDDENNTPEYKLKGKISRWFVRRCHDDIFDLKARLKDKDSEDTSEQREQLDNALPSREALAYYNHLVQQQDEILESGTDEQTFRYALQQFPYLTKVTVTPATHGFLFMPLYETPMIRAFPRGFVYPIPRGWPCAGTADVPEDANPWEDEDEKNKWHGFCIVSRVLADPQLHHNITELALDNHKLPTGINHFVFDQPNDEYDNLCQVLERPSFKRIVLSLLVGYLWEDDHENWAFFQKGKIRNLLAQAPNLEEVTYQTDYPVDDTQWAGKMIDYVSLFDIFPIDQWSSGCLRHFGLSGMQVTQDELISLLAKLPPTLQSVELSFLSVLEGQGSHAGILTDIRDKLDWRQRPVDRRIKVRVLARLDEPSIARYVRFDKEVHDYIYGEGPQPFGVHSGGSSHGTVRSGIGTRCDEFDSGFKIPFK